jgi:hypothetical protein
VKRGGYALSRFVLPQVVEPGESPGVQHLAKKATAHIGFLPARFIQSVCVLAQPPSPTHYAVEHSSVRLMDGPDLVPTGCDNPGG